MAIPSSQFCGACKYWVSADGKVGECHAYPPQQGLSILSIRPMWAARVQTLAGDVACSAYVARS